MAHYMTVAHIETRSRATSTRPLEAPELPAHVAEEGADKTLCNEPTQGMRVWAKYPHGAAHKCGLCMDELEARKSVPQHSATLNAPHPGRAAVPRGVALDRPPVTDPAQRRARSMD